LASGWNFEGQLGDGTNEIRFPLLRIGTDNDWLSVKCGSNFHLVKKDSSIWAWGGNSHGQLGNKSNQNVFNPIKLSFEKNGQQYL